MNNTENTPPENEYRYTPPNNPPPNWRKLATAFATLAVIVAITYVLSLRHAGNDQTALTDAAPTQQSAAAPVTPSATESSTAVADANAASNGAPTTPARSKEDVLAVTADDVPLGPDTAPVTVIEYASLSCSHCANFHNNVLPALKTKYIDSGQVRFIHRFFPLNDPALLGAQLVRCADRSQFHTFLNVLFKSQEQWAFDPSFRESLASVAGVGGMSRETFDGCMADKASQEKILLTRLEAANSLNVKSTPTFFVNGTMHEGEQSIEKMSAIIDPLLSPAK